ncbi:MAG: hypothetical protein IKZ81_03425 [Clostridia bacterium]|nr:hypothetical protein [Clostridia bacterium]
MRLDLTELKGNNTLLSAFSAAVTSGRVPHTWIIEGPDGSGKHTFASLFCRVMMCDGELRPCGECGNCKRAAAGHIDVHYIVPLKSDRKTVGVDEIRALREEAYINPTSARCKVYIVEDAETVTPAGQNALLKLAEEPPENVYFLLLTRNRHALLPTLISRAVCYSMEPLSYADAKAALGRVRGADDEKIETALRLSGGFVGTAKEFLKGETLASGISAAEKFLEALAANDEYALMMCFSSVSDSREKARSVLTAIAAAVAETIRVKSGMPDASKLPIGDAERKAASAVGFGTLAEVYEQVTSAENDVAAYVNVNAALTELTINVAAARRENK